MSGSYYITLKVTLNLHSGAAAAYIFIVVEDVVAVALNIEPKFSFQHFAHVE